MGHVPLTTPVFDHSSFSCSGDMIGAYQNLNSYVT